MKSICFILSLAIILLAGCDQNQADGEVADSLDLHRDALSRFQDGQVRFKKLMATIRDEQSYDEAKPKLDRIVADWHEVAATLRGLGPPSDQHKLEFREMIAEGHRSTEPTAMDLMSLFSIETREADITKWFQDFADAAGEAGAELSRLYGPTDYSNPEESGPVIELDSEVLNGASLDQFLNDPEALIPQSQKAGQGSAGQPASQPGSESEGGEKP